MWKYNKEKYVGQYPFIRLYRVVGKSSFLFNLLFNVEDWQGDGYVRTTLILFSHAIQLVIPFDNNKRRTDFRWSLLKRI